MDGKWKLSLRDLFGLVAIVAVALAITRYFLSLLPMDVGLAGACFLFGESAITVACWAIAIDGLVTRNSRPGNLASAIFATLILLFTFSLFLPG